MKNIFYEYHHDKAQKMVVSKGNSSVANPHFHRATEILYVLKGEVDSTVGDAHFVAKADEIIFVHNYDIHSFMPKTEYKKYFMIITPNYEDDIDKIFTSSTLPRLLADREYNREKILPIFKKLYNEKEALSPLVKKGYVNVLVGNLLERYPKEPLKISSNVEIIINVLQYIDEHYSEPLDLDTVASAFGYNKYYFSRMFNRYIGENLSNYINVVRLRSFMQSYKDYGVPQISKLATECGFESMPTFYRTFIKIYGESPKSYFSHS